MSEYPKTENLFVRDEETHKLIPGQFRSPTFGQIDRWLVTEKIDGTNIRLVLEWITDDAPDFQVFGRSDAANLPKLFQEEALPGATCARMVDAWRAIDPAENTHRMVVYGEGYGPGIQKGGGSYAPRKSLRIFDVRTYRRYEVSEPPRGLVEQEERSLWRPWADVETVAEVLGLKTAPVIGRGMSMDEIVGNFYGPSYYSHVALEETGEQIEAEGVIARTDPYLYDAWGSRVMFKLKGKDLPATLEASGVAQLA